jgi:uncharacterized protein (TIGR02246 family)
MKNMIVLIVLILSAGGPTAGFAKELKTGPDEAPPATQTQAQSPQSADEKAIRASADEFVAAFNKGDAKGIAVLWTPDCEYVDETGHVFRGRDSIEKQYAEFFRTNPGVQIEASASSVKILGPVVAVDDGTAMVKDPQGKLVSRGYYTAVLMKEDGKWLMASVREHASSSAADRLKIEDLGWLIGEWAADQESKKADLTFKWIADKKFIELAYKLQDKKGDIRSGIQIIGQDPSSGELTSWSFYANGGSGRSKWRPFQKDWIIDSFGRMPDGRRSFATYLMSRPDENTLSLRSMNRRIAGKRLKDTEAVILKRKPQ